MAQLPVAPSIIFLIILALGLPEVCADRPDRGVPDDTGQREGMSEGSDSGLPQFYHTSEDLRRFATELAAPGPGHCPGLRLVRSTFPESNAATGSVPIKKLEGVDAQTYKGSPGEGAVDALFISRLGNATTSKPPVRYALFFGEHGRELISAEVGMYLLKAFCGRADVDADVRQRAQELLSHAEILVLPNVDESGRRYAEQHHYCQRGNYEGVDLNRNWGYKWGEDLDGGNDKGARPFSEPESQIARDHLEAFKPDAFLSVHSGDRALWTPGAYDIDDTATKRQLGASWNTLLSIASNVNDYTKCDCRVGAPGKVANVRHPGTSIDYAGLKMNVPYAMAWEIWLDQKRDCLPHFSPTVHDDYARVLQRWSLAMVYFAESAAGALNGVEPGPVRSHPRVVNAPAAIDFHSSNRSLRLARGHNTAGASPDDKQPQDMAGRRMQPKEQQRHSRKGASSLGKHGEPIGHLRASLLLSWKRYAACSLVIVCMVLMCVAGFVSLRDPVAFSRKILNSR